MGLYIVPFPCEFNPKFFREDNVVEQIFISADISFLLRTTDLSMQNVRENKHDIFNDIFMIFSTQILQCLHFFYLNAL